MKISDYTNEVMNSRFLSGRESGVLKVKIEIEKINDTNNSHITIMIDNYSKIFSIDFGHIMTKEEAIKIVQNIMDNYGVIRITENINNNINFVFEPINKHNIQLIYLNIFTKDRTLVKQLNDIYESLIDKFLYEPSKKYMLMKQKREII